MAAVGDAPSAALSRRTWDRLGCRSVDIVLDSIWRNPWRVTLTTLPISSRVVGRPLGAETLQAV